MSKYSYNHIGTTYLTYGIRGEEHSEWALEFFSSGPALPSPPSPPPAPFIPPSAPVPSTPLPFGVVFGGTPAWDPSSRTPIRSRLREDDDVQEISKPAGKLNRTGGFSHKDALEMEDSLYSEIKVCTDIDREAILSDGCPRNTLNHWLINTSISVNLTPSKVRLAVSSFQRRQVSKPPTYLCSLT